MRHLVVLLLVVPLLVLAQSNHHNNSGDTSLDVITSLAGGDVSTRSLALGQSLGDVDIAGCIVTTQWGIILYQRQHYEYDVYCIADQLDEVGKYADAAAMRCTHPEAAKLYGSRCLDVMNYKPPPNLGPTPARAERAATRAQEEEERNDRLDKIEQRMDQEAAARRSYARQFEAEKKADQQRARDALTAYKAVQQEEPEQ